MRLATRLAGIELEDADGARQRLGDLWRAQPVPGCGEDASSCCRRGCPSTRSARCARAPGRRASRATPGSSEACS